MEKVAPTHPAGVVEFATPARRSTLSRAAKTGRAMRLAAGVYVTGATLPAQRVAAHHAHAIVAHYWPNSVISGVCALAGGLPVDGRLYITHPNPPRLADLHLPGITVTVAVGPGPLPGDMSLPHGLFLAGGARLLVENATSVGRPAKDGSRRSAGLAAVEDRIDDDARIGGAGRIRNQLAQLDIIAGHFTPKAVGLVRERLVAVLGTFTAQSSPAVSARLGARLARIPYDEHRIRMFQQFAAALADRAPQPIPALGPAGRWAWEPFFEAYFSNFIEGTEFGVEEARHIAIDGATPEDRPEDAHDISATYQVAMDEHWSAFTAKTGGEFIDALREIHAVLMAARPDKRPGKFKEKPNFAGGYAFVDPDLVEGTLRRGFDTFTAVIDPFQRACALMLLATECHPFDDGNGRTARLAANATLTAAGQVRVIVPTVYRGNYLAGLAAVSADGRHADALLDVLGFAQRWTAAIDWTDFDTAEAQIRDTNADLDAALADRTGRRLQLPKP